MIKLGAMWISKNPKVAYSGQLDGDALPKGKIPIIVFKNSKKERENQPDYIIYLSEPKGKPKKDDTEGVPF